MEGNELDMVQCNIDEYVDKCASLINKGIVCIESIAEQLGLNAKTSVEYIHYHVVKRTGKIVKLYDRVEYYQKVKPAKVTQKGTITIPATTLIGLGFGPDDEFIVAPLPGEGFTMHYFRRDEEGNVILPSRLN